VLTPGYYARQDTRTPVRYAMISVGVNLVGNLILIPTLGVYGFGHVGPPLATALASFVNVALLYRMLKRRGHFAADQRLKRRLPRLAIASVLMGAAVYALAPLAAPYLTGSILERVAALLVLTGGGALTYAIACFLTGAFRLSDLRALLTRRAATAKKD
jgi:putative peptidoglycan lipid II flippase